LTGVSQIKQWVVLAAAIAIACSRGPVERTDSSQAISAGSDAPVHPAASNAAAGAPPKLELEVTRIHHQRRFAWRQVREVNWQAVADGLAPLPEAKQRGSGACPTGMLPIDGGFLVDPDGRDDTDFVLGLQNQSCTLWRTRNHGVEGLCDRFDRDRWLRAQAQLRRKPLSFCIDRYEFPNVHGEFPLVAVTFAESEAYCARAGKRLCTESEWTFACEGPEGMPYPYGYERDKSACNVDVLAAGAPATTFQPRTLPSTARGIDAAWQGRRSGASPGCVGPFGVEDLTGNVDEWTRSVRRYGYRMIMKGGHWGPARQRCRPQTRGHGPRYLRYDQGFRCCQNLSR
jgi:hypothetical protein